jgi:3-phytase
LIYKLYHIRELLLISLLVLSASGSSPAQVAAIRPVRSSSPTPGVADDPAIWIHPTRPESSVVIGTDKENGLFVWDLEGRQLQYLPQVGTTNNVDLRYQVQLGSEKLDIVAANLRSSGKLAVFKVNKHWHDGQVLTQLADGNSQFNDLQKDSYGFSLYKRPWDGALFIIEKPKNSGKIRQYLVSGSNNMIHVTPVRDLNYNGGVTEGFLADDDLGYLYVPEEGRGIHKYHADPAGGDDELLIFALEDSIRGDREGMGLYRCDNGSGYLLLSSQGNSTVKIYDRVGNNRFLKTVQMTNHLGKTGLGTDGLDVTSFPAAPLFPNGLVVLHDEANRRFHYYDWAQIAGTNLNVCPQTDRMTAVEKSDDTPMQAMELQLEQNYPNPVQSRTGISYTLHRSGQINLEIYDIRGNRVALLENGSRNPGQYQYLWQRRTDLGGKCASGTYFVRLQMGDRFVVKKMTLLH